MNNKALKELQDLEASLKRMGEYAHNKKVGYEPKCKICNSKHQNEVEALREDGSTLEDIKDFLEEKGEEVSLMGISRHFDRHYPARKKYLLGLDEERIQAIEEGNKKIDEELKYSPEFKEELESNHTFYDFVNGDYKGITKKGREIYIFDHGYCLTGDRFCKLVPKLRRYGGNEVTDNIETEIFKINAGLVNDFMGEKKTKLLEDALKCTNCQLMYNDFVTYGILKLVLMKHYGIEMESEEFKEIILKEDFIYEDFDKELQKIASRERAKAQDNP